MGGPVSEGSNGHSMTAQEAQLLLTKFVPLQTTQFYPPVEPKMFYAGDNLKSFWQSCSIAK